jgi:hypothetical protein
VVGVVKKNAKGALDWEASLYDGEITQSRSGVTGKDGKKIEQTQTLRPRELTFSVAKFGTKYTPQYLGLVRANVNIMVEGKWPLPLTHLLKWCIYSCALIIANKITAANPKYCVYASVLPGLLVPSNSVNCFSFVDLLWKAIKA